MEGGAEALDEQRQGRDTLLLHRSDCNGEEVPVAVDGRCNEGDAAVLRLEWHPSTPRAFGEWTNADAHIPKHRNERLRSPRRGERP